MPTPRVTIDQLPEQAAPEDANLLVVHDGDTTKKMSIATLKTIETAGLAAHIADPIGAHAATAISATPSGAGITGADVQAQLGQLASLADASINQGEGDARYLQLSGGAVSGALSVATGLTSSGETIVQPPTQVAHAATKGYVDSADALKADKTYVDTKDDTKADITYVDAADALKADKTYVDSADALKADRTYVDAQDATKASITYVDSADALKADKTYVDSQDATKATIAYVDNKDATKADITYVNSADALKADKTYVDAQLATKMTPAQADTAYVNITGDTLTGPLLLAANPSANLGAATKQYVDTAMANNNHTYVDNSPPPLAAYLTPTVGTATTPDPGVPPNDCTFVYKVRANLAGPDQNIVAQFEGAPNNSWGLHTSPNEPSVYWYTSNNGTNLTLAGTITVPRIFTAVDEWHSLSVSSTTLTGRKSIDGGVTWTQIGTTPNTQPTLFDSSSVMRVGLGAGGLGVYQGRIYSVELRSGLDPAAGSVLWKFDANDYPGTGTSYTDPRGRTWTLTSASAITKPSRPAVNGDLHIDTTTDLVYRYNGTTWTSQGLIGDAAVAASPLVATRPHLYLPGTTGNYISTPDPAALAGATQLDIRWIEKAPPTGAAGYGPTAAGMAAQQTNGVTSCCFAMYAVAGTAQAQLRLSTTGTTYVDSGTSTIRPTSGVAACRWTWRSSDGQVKSYTKAIADVAGMLDNTGWTTVNTYTQLAGQALFNSVANLQIGASDPSGAGATLGNPLAWSFATTIDGTPFALWRADPMARQYTDDYGTRWTINGSAWEWRDANGLQIGGPQASDVITGSGFPEGVVTAPIGQRYIDTAVTAGAIEWIKVAGAGNTGWQISHGDTGRRNIVGLLTNGWTAQAVLLRRTNAQVELIFYALDGTAATSNDIIIIPTGFRYLSYVQVVPLWDVTKFQQMVNRGDNGVFDTPARANGMYSTTTWQTSQPWPATLP